MKLEVRHLKKSYFRAGVEIPVLADINFELEKGETLAVIGASGIGKSTLLHCLGLIDQITAGEIYLDQVCVSKGGSETLAQNRRRSMGFVFQFHYLMAELSALENVMVPLLLSKMNETDAKRRAVEWLERVGLGHRLSHRPSELSGGEQQRVSIARALVHQPQVILADEPTGNLDPETGRRVCDVLIEQCRELNSILIMATHNYELAGLLSKKAHLQKGNLEWAS